jgi:hypothetical protein
MFGNNNNINREEYPTTKVYNLRKEGRLVEAYNLAYSLYQKDSTNDDIKKALSWTLIDLCKKYIADNNHNQIPPFFNLLSNLEFKYEDNFVETIQKQIKFLEPKINPNYSQIQTADELSKNGQEKQALDIVRTMITNNQLSELYHGTYGWIIYRYLKSVEESTTSIEIRTLLRDYMNLKNERPSMLHSMILNFALNYSKTHSDFNFYNFFVLWDPENLRNEDLKDGFKDGGKIPSLISRICREFVDSNSIADLDDIIKRIKLTLPNSFPFSFEDKNKNSEIIDLFREPYFWNLFNAHKENKFDILWRLFNKYNETYSKYGKSKWHTEILKLADRFMKENESWRFLPFFKEWNPNNFMDADWKEEKGKDGEAYKPLAIKAIKKVFEIVKNQQNRNADDLSWLIESYYKVVKIFPDDEWLIREKALLHIWQKDFDIAKSIYKKLVLELADKFYVWNEFSDCFENDNRLKIGMFSKALSLEKNEDFLGEIHLKLAKILIDNNLLENALIELDTYKKHRVEKEWKLAQDFDKLYQKVSSVRAKMTDNTELYKQYIPFAEEFAYQDIEWTEVVLVDKWKDDKGKERLTFIDGKSMEFAVGIHRFAELKKAKAGQVWNFKLQKQEIKKEVESKYRWQAKTIITEYKYLPLIAKKSENKDWAVLEDCFAVVEYINAEKNVIHAITSDNKEVFFSQNNLKLEIGHFVKAKSYTKTVKGEKRIELCGFQIIDKQEAIIKFQTNIALVDGINESKQLFHFVISSSIQGIVRYNETELRPQEGDFLRIIYTTKIDKKANKARIKVLEIQKTEEINDDLIRTISGHLKVKYKNYNYEEKPDFAFVGDYYVPKYLLEKHNITNDCQVKAKAIFAGDKWKVIEIEEL